MEAWFVMTLRYLLNGENAEVHLNGLFVVKENHHTDNHTMVEHRAPNCFSNELYKGVIADNGTGVFNGKILVYRDAQKTNAYQSNKNILWVIRPLSIPNLSLKFMPMMCVAHMAHQQEC